MNGKQVSMCCKALRVAIAVVTLGANMSAFSATTWKEEALLHDGSKIIVTRTVERGGRHEIGQRPTYKEQSLGFTLPSANQHVIWEDKFSGDIGTASFLPMQLDVFNGVPYIVVSPMGCLSYNKWGRPNPPYVVFRHDGNAWQRIPLQDLPIEAKNPNLVISSPDDAAIEAYQGVVSAEKIKELNTGFRQPEYKTILREAYPGASGNCGEMAGNGKGQWLGMGWFKEQPSLDACLELCVRKAFDAQHCPCKDLFKGK